MSRAKFMRDAKNGIKLQLVGGDIYEWIKERKPQNLRARGIVKVQTNAIYLEEKENNSQGSYLEIPRSSLMEYDGKTLNIYDPALREMNEEEKLNVRRAEEEREKYQKENPYSDDFWHMKAWYNKCSTPWIYSGNEKVKGKRAAGGKDRGKIWDDAIKGKLILQYTVLK